MGGKWAEEGTLKLTVDNGKFNKEVDQSNKKLDTIGGTAKRVGEVLAGTFGSQALMSGLRMLGRGAGELVSQFKEAQDAASGLELSTSRLRARLEVSGDTFEKHASKIDAASEAMFRYAGASKGEVMDALSQLFNYTGDMDNALNSLAATYDFMAVTGQGLTQASRNIAMTWEGEIGLLGRMIPALKDYSKEQMRAGEHMKEFSKWQGQATAKTSTYSGTWETLLGQVKDFKAIMAQPVNDAIKPALDSLAETIHQLNSSGSLDKTKDLLGGIANNLVLTANALFGGAGVDGAIDGLNLFLTRIEGYTGSTQFLSDLQAISSLIGGIAKAGIKAGQVVGAITGSGSMFEGFARGGAVGVRSGYIPGTFKGDRIPLAGEGEYVVNPTATAKHKSLLDYINYIDTPSQFTGPGYAAGGMVDEAYMRRRFAGAKSLDWIISQLNMGANGLVNLETFMSRNVAPSSFGAATYAIAQLRKEHGPAETRAARDQLFGAVQSGLAQASAEARTRRDHAVNAFSYFSAGYTDRIKMKADSGATLTEAEKRAISTSAPGGDGMTFDQLMMDPSQMFKTGDKLFPMPKSAEYKKGDVNFTSFFGGKKDGKTSLSDTYNMANIQSILGPDFPIGIDLSTKNLESQIAALKHKTALNPKHRTELEKTDKLGIIGKTASTLPIGKLWYFFKNILSDESLPGYSAGWGGGSAGSGQYFNRGYQPAFHSGGIVPGAYPGQERWVKALAGEEILPGWNRRGRSVGAADAGMSPTRQKQTEELAVGQAETNSLLRETVSELRSMKTRGNIASEAQIGRVVARLCSAAGVDIFEMREDIDEQKRRTRTAG